MFTGVGFDLKKKINSVHPLNFYCLFFCKKEAELLEPLMPAIRNCLEHRHSYVRRNAVMAIYTIYR